MLVLIPLLTGAKYRICVYEKMITKRRINEMKMYTFAPAHVHGEKERKLIKEINCTQRYPAQFIVNGTIHRTVLNISLHSTQTIHTKRKCFIIIKVFQKKLSNFFKNLTSSKIFRSYWAEVVRTNLSALCQNLIYNRWIP